MTSIGTQFVDKKRLPAFLNDSLLKKSWTINQTEQKPAMQMMGVTVILKDTHLPWDW